MNTVLKNVSKAYGDNVVFKDFNLELSEGKITSVLGESGSGKTTLLNILADLIPYEGEVQGKGHGVSYIFQSSRLVPNLTVEKNVDYVLRSQIKDKRERAAYVEKYLDMVEMSAHAKKYPAELSGGMAQRVSIARAFAYKSDLLLMDEPFKEMDIGLKKRLIDVFLRLYTEKPRTVVFVTHEIDEALLISDRIAVLAPPSGILADVALSSDKANRDLNSEELIKARATLLDTLISSSTTL